MIVAFTLLAALSASPAGASEPLTGKMSIYSTLLGARWTCTLGPTKYFAAYDVGPGNTLHGRLYSKDSSEDTYYGYDAAHRRFWTDIADSSGETMSQTSSDGMTFVGTLNDGSTVTKATNSYTIANGHKLIVRARGTAGGHPYDVTSTCTRT